MRWLQVMFMSLRWPAGVCKLIGAALTLQGLALPSPAHAEPPTLRGEPPPLARRAGTLRVESPVNQAGTVLLHWNGTIAAPMHDQLLQAFEAFKSSRTRFMLVLNSGGGSVGEGERVIALLRRIRRTHRFDTSVRNGSTCGSMCVPLFLQGDRRYGARTSAWLLHEVTQAGSLPGRKKKVEGRYEALIRTHGLPVGVSEAWINKVLPLTEGYDVWLTGQELIAEGSGIITDPIESRTKRDLEPPAALGQARAPGL